jgi:hypothetical protein
MHLEIECLLPGGREMQLAINQFLELATIMERHLEKYLGCQLTELLVVVDDKIKR